MIKSTLEDSFEKLVEQGSTQAKKAAKTVVKQVSSTISSTKMWEQILGVDSNGDKTGAVKEKKGETASNHTPLNLEKLGKSYQDLESQKTEILKQRLFQLVKRGEEQVLQDKKKEEQEKKQKEFFESQEKERIEEQKKKQEQVAEIPKGKVRRSIFSPKKVAQRQHAELKPSTGKQ
ncbi:hypothetical protein A3C98_01440 [Candidatus Roizmanbacteria bacterium RIFCSPHIGHO2_02_FULL_37_15]|uniref:Uncharacterized protein n=1 Tax=Candidatus Roizmanbacteria bacterium RIFCSPLOWO2_01_FULL_37_16 TaxID=1802058 RepID=A0A1F7IQI5_9BACT|nr:MAG: hypothetical protein A2859_00345 [Candidatus Roizmanbacteria bacterium RIFCSPHIGHO2_01_FULL_37_16b]OGK21137.1 MAG: hypothetical protein A3C98_01440 [Candidatus Roizmanbacteria bacterium RIFCSPHIGHO2_02_FULL_37_15]OGK32754.1 MAG: hypothetical protein A3F57_02155 [Candidatus Roizmanbacteria bacterium RIFCSPHIGHO2_12_FULL_36_11]OGK45615.1 MAG: hypothetical protein A3B40_00280 [Candidatus Roizmanbacteria bacterium RIFCSPLOWO2_01_FULL_37_16]OGK56650.1 MAG: hypothetical protein A3I50_01265 [C